MQYYYISPKSDSPYLLTNHKVQSLAKGEGFLKTSLQHILFETSIYEDIGYPIYHWVDFFRQGDFAHAFVVSDQLKKLLEKFNLPAHRFYQVEVAMNVGASGTNIGKYEERAYHVFHMIHDWYELIDFANTVFKVSDTQSGKSTKWTKGEIRSPTELMELSKMFYDKGKMIEPSQFVFLDGNPDLFFFGDVCVSEKLKHAIEETNLVGITITSQAVN